jgi:hypothetical protein
VSFYKPTLIDLRGGDPPSRELAAVVVRSVDASWLEP